MFINKTYNRYMIEWLKVGNLNKIISIANSALELRQFANKQEHCERLVLFVKGV